MRAIRAAAVAAATAVLAAASGYAVAYPIRAAAVAGLPIALLCVMFPGATLVAATALAPFSQDLGRGHAGPLHVSASDLLLALGFAGALVGLLAPGPLRSLLHGLSPLRWPLAVYFAALLLAFAAHPTSEGVAAIAQRFELVVVSLVAAVVLVDRGLVRPALRLYLASAVVVALAIVGTTLVRGDISNSFIGIQKNPAGQAVVSALLLLVADRSLLRLRAGARTLLLLLLVGGVVASLSRGAILAMVVGLVVVAAYRAPQGRLPALLVLPVVAVGIVGAFQLLPADQQNRLTDVNPNSDYASGERVDYAHDAIAVIRSAPLLGVGPGNYLTGFAADATQTDDPHDVVLLQFAEGGVVLGSAFLLLASASLLVVVRRLRRLGPQPLLLAALAVQLAILVHGLFDIYWVRGTPVLGWLLVGAALASTHREAPRRRDQERADLARVL